MYLPLFNIQKIKFILIGLGCIFLHPTFAQLPDFQMGIIDLETAPADRHDYQQHLVVSGKLFYVLGESSNALWCIGRDGEAAKLLHEADDIDLLGVIGNEVAFYLEDSNEIAISDGTPEGTNIIYTYDGFLRDPYFLGDKMIFLNYQNILISDGTSDGNVLIDQFDRIKEEAFILNDQLFFLADDGVIGEEIWTTDGTQSGTKMLKDLMPDNGSSGSPSKLIISNNKLYFIHSGYTEYTGNELWVSDGTDEGTRLVKEVRVGDWGGQIEGLSDAGNKLFFSAIDGVHGRELWRSDGTEEGTFMVKDIVEGDGYGLSYNSNLITQNGIALFVSGSTPDGGQIWRSDGTAEGTFALTEELATGNWDFDYQPIAHESTSTGETFLIIQNRFLDQYELWITDGTVEGTEQLTTFGEYPKDIKLVDDQFFFHEYFMGDRNLWISDGTIAGTTLLGTYEIDDVFPSYQNLYLFTIYDVQQGPVLWRSDGTSDGTYALYEEFEESIRFEPEGINTIGDSLYFFANHSTYGSCIYASDGTSDGTEIFYDIYDYTASSDIDFLQAGGGKLYFTNGNHLWSSKGNVAQTIDLDTYFTGFRELEFVNTTGFHADGDLLYVTDGSPEGSGLLADFNPTGWAPIGDQLLDYKDELWFMVNHDDFGQEWWKSDGTAEGTSLAFETLAGTQSLISVFSESAASEELIFFSADDPATGKEPWVSDGTKEGTFILKDINPGIADSKPNNFFLHNDKMFFTVSGENAGLWVSDGTEVGTVKIADVVFARFEKRTHGFNSEYLFFTSSDGLWITNGTAEGTQLVSASGSFSTISLTRSADKVYFIKDDDQLWVSDGTTEGTVMAKDLTAEDINYASKLFGFRGYLFFAAHSSITGDEIWVSDGTSEGTYLLIDLYEGYQSSNPKDFTAYKEKLYFIANDGKYGEEVRFLDFGFQPDVKGMVFHDEDGNGQMNGDEAGLEDIGIIALQQNAVTFSEENGEFELFLQDWNDTITVDTELCWEITTTPTQYSIAPGSNIIENLLFGLSSTSTYQNFTPYLHSGPTRCGFTVPYWLSLKNTGCTDLGGKMGLVVSDLVEIIEMDIMPTSQSGDTLWWENINLLQNATYQVKLQLKMPNEDFDGEIISMEVLSFYQNDNSGLTAGTTYKYDAAITCAIDPNDKLVNPSRAAFAERNYTAFAETLDYTIRFQNTGSDTAINIRIEDHLSPLLDWATFQPGVSSHKYQADLDKEGLVSFYFPDIYLPDSTTNEIASQGFVSFTIKAKQDLKEFDEIKNEAAIFFDFNRPIITNTIENVMLNSLDADEDGFPFWEDCEDGLNAVNPDAIDIPNNGIDENCDGVDLMVGLEEIAGEKIRIYPVPTQSHIYIDYEGASTLEGRIYSPSGQFLKKTSIKNGRTSFNVEELPSGILFLEIRSNGNSYMQKIIKL